MDRKIILAVLVVALIGVIAATYNIDSDNGLTDPLASIATEDIDDQVVANALEAGDSQNSIFGDGANSLLRNNDEDSDSEGITSEVDIEGAGSDEGDENAQATDENSEATNENAQATDENAEASTDNQNNVHESTIVSESTSSNTTSDTSNSENTSGSSNTSSNDSTTSNSSSDTNSSGNNISIERGTTIAQDWLSSQSLHKDAQAQYSSSFTDNNETYYVYVFKENGEVVGEIEVNSETGQVSGGAFEGEVPDPDNSNSSSTNHSSASNSTSSNTTSGSTNTSSSNNATTNNSTRN